MLRPTRGVEYRRSAGRPLHLQLRRTCEECRQALVHPAGKNLLRSLRIRRTSRYYRTVCLGLSPNRRVFIPRTTKLIFHVFAALAEFERDLIRERTSAGLAAARSRGRNGGRPAKLTERQIAMARRLLSDLRLASTMCVGPCECRDQQFTGICISQPPARRSHRRTGGTLQFRSVNCCLNPSAGSFWNRTSIWDSGKLPATTRFRMMI